MTSAELKTYLAQTGIKQKTLAAQLGCPPSRISEWKNGKRPMPKHYAITLRLLQENLALKAQLAQLKNLVWVCGHRFGGLF